MSRAEREPADHVLLVGFGSPLRRRPRPSAWIQVVHGPSIRGDGVAAAPRDDRRSPPAAARSSTAPARRSRSASRRRPSTPTRGTSPTPNARRSSPAEAFGLDPNELYARLARPLHRLPLREAQGRPGDGGGAREAGDPRPRLLRRGAAHAIRSARVAAHVLGFAGIDNNGLEGLERSLDGKLAGRRRLRDDRPRPLRPPDRRRHVAGRSGRAATSADDRPRDPGGGRGDPRRRPSRPGARRGRRRS